MTDPRSARAAKTVLVVDDEPMLREAMADTLRDEGYAILEASDGRAAVELFTRERPDLVLMDVMMPVLDGTQAFAMMRSHQPQPPTPVVMMSAAIGLEMLDVGIAGFLAKPFDLDRLVDLVTHLIGDASADQGDATPR